MIIKELFKKRITVVLERDASLSYTVDRRYTTFMTNAIDKIGLVMNKLGKSTLLITNKKPKSPHITMKKVSGGGTFEFKLEGTDHRVGLCVSSLVSHFGENPDRLYIM